jgi:hypothetical protein
VLSRLKDLRSLLLTISLSRISVANDLYLLLLLSSCCVLADSHLDFELGAELIGFDFSLLSVVLVIVMIVMELAHAPVLATFGLL